MSNFVENLKDLLKDRNLSMLEFAKLINIPFSTIYNLKFYNPSTKNALLIVDYFSSSLDYFENITDKFEYSYNDNYEINFYKNLRENMKLQNKTKIQLCYDLGISHSTLDRWRNGTLPSYTSLLSVAKYLGCSIDALLGRV